MKRSSLTFSLAAVILFSWLAGNWQCIPVSSLSGSACTPDAISASLPVPLLPQTTDKWCWAASGQMCMQFIGTTDVRQCVQANNKFGLSNCCNAIVPGDCINGSFPEFEKYNFSCNRTSNNALSWNEIKKQISCLHKPVAFTWKYNGGGGHMMVLTGYQVVGNEKLVVVNDPLEVNIGSTYTLSYDEYVSSSIHTHWDDFYNITKN